MTSAAWKTVPVTPEMHPRFHAAVFRERAGKPLECRAGYLPELQPALAKDGFCGLVPGGRVEEAQQCLDRLAERPQPNKGPFRLRLKLLENRGSEQKLELGYHWSSGDNFSWYCATAQGIKPEKEYWLHDSFSLVGVPLFALLYWALLALQSLAARLYARRGSASA